MKDVVCSAAAMFCLSRKHCFNIALAVVLLEILVILWSEMRLHVWSDSDVLLEQLNGYVDDESPESFLRLYRSYCDEHFYPKMSNMPSKFLPHYNDSLCPCVPDTLGLYYDRIVCVVSSLLFAGSALFVS